MLKAPHGMRRSHEGDASMWAIALKEFRQLRRDRRTVAMLFLLPFGFLVIFGYAASFDIKEVPTLVVGPRAAADDVGVLVTTHHLEEAAYCDRLVVMDAGRVAADGTLGAIVGDRRAVEVRCRRWEGAFAALQRAGLESALVGRALRVTGAEARDVRAALDASGVAATLGDVPATLEETFVALVGGSASPVPERTSA